MFLSTLMAIIRYYASVTEDIRKGPKTQSVMVKLSLCLLKHHTLKAYGQVEV